MSNEYPYASMRDSFDPETLPSMKLNHWHDVRDWYRAFLNVGARADIVPLAYDWSSNEAEIDC